MQPDVADLEAHRALLTAHCYRMLGSAADAEDAVQETMVRAWRGLGRFEGRAAVKTWLHRIATNVCLDLLSDVERKRVQPIDLNPAGTIDDPLEALHRTHWLEPIPDARAIPVGADPFEAVAMRQSIRLAFVAALQQLPPKQRAALILAEVLGWSAAEIAECLDTSVASVNSALQRARTTIGNQITPKSTELSDEQTALLDRYLDAFHRYDVDALVATLHHDATFTMPPYTLWLRGSDAVRGWLYGRGSVCRGSKLIPISANGAPAFAHYHASNGGYAAWAIIALELQDDRIASWCSFLDVQNLFPLFDLPMALDA